MAERRTFGPVVLAGIATAVLAAVAGNQAWAAAEGTGEAGQLARVASGLGAGAGEVPAAGAAALVCLAAWGALLVTRGRWRRGIAVLAALAAIGYAAAVVIGFTAAPDGVEAATADLGLTAPDVARTGWYWAAAAVAPAVLATTLLAVRLVPTWPEMGNRYDAPSGSPAPTVTSGNLDLWRAMDEGHDPTA